MIDKACAIGNFVKFGSGGAIHHNNPITTNCLFVVVNSSTISSVALPFPKTNHDPPFKLVNVYLFYYFNLQFFTLTYHYLDI